MEYVKKCATLALFIALSGKSFVHNMHLLQNLRCELQEKLPRVTSLIFFKPLIEKDIEC